MIFKGLKAGFCLTGSFCTFKKALEQMEYLVKSGCEIVPIMSENAFSTDTRFAPADSIRERITALCGREIISGITAAEPVGPADMTDIMIVAPCTGNTMAKLAASITDTPATMAVKSHLRRGKPVVIACATNDALAGSLKNIGALMNYKNYYFVPFCQDDSEKKPFSLVADFSAIPKTVELALKGVQIQPVIYAAEK